MNKEAFAEVVLTSTDSLYRISKAILHEDADCEDAVQEAIVLAFDKLGTLRKEEYAKTWLTRILINECYRILRQKKREVLIEEESVFWQNQHNDYSELYQSIMRLNEKQRLVIVLHHLEGYSVEEVAKLLKMPKGTVKSHLCRARKVLRKLLEEERYEYVC